MDKCDTCDKKLSRFILLRKWRVWRTKKLMRDFYVMLKLHGVEECKKLTQEKFPSMIPLFEKVVEILMRGED